MKKFIPKEKPGKKVRRELDRQQRIFWTRSPVSRTMKSKKTYDRHTSHDIQKDWISWVFLSDVNEQNDL